MSDQNQKPSIKDRIKTHLPVFALGIVTGAAVTVVLYKPTVVNNIIQAVPEDGSVLLSARLVKQIRDIGEGMTELEPGRFVDIIDWGHPNIENRASKM